MSAGQVRCHGQASDSGLTINGVSDLQPGSIRIGDAEREQAVQALGEHMSSGRLTIDEYGDRSARISAAKTRGELEELFTDLPQPHPRFDASAAAHPPMAHSGTPATPPAQRSQLPQRLAAAAMPLTAIVAVVLFFTTGWWAFFLLPAAVAVVGGTIWGDTWKDQQRTRHAEAHAWRRELRARRRGRR